MKNHPYRFIYNNDGWEPFIRYNAPIELKHILESVNELARTQVDTVCWCLASEVANYPSRKIERAPNLPDTVLSAWHGFLARGVDPVKHVVERAHEVGLKILGSVRMNDCHHKSDPRGECATKFWREHQPYRLWDIDEAHGYYNAALDYSHAEVRQRRLEVSSVYPPI